MREGSSPLTRGKLIAAARGSPFARLIPAHAGKTITRADARPWPRAHPRSRGENAAEETAVDIHLGSSPLTRGKRVAARCVLRSCGLIPAHAGKTLGRSRRSFPRRAHPRSRGENHAAIDWVARSEGSSPLTRGKHHDHHRTPRLRGLIPAHAGKTFVLMRGPPGSGAHPRSRGENSGEFVERVNFRGSSPLTRGKQSPCPLSFLENGLIPAHAGKTPKGPNNEHRDRAHPRSRGENRMSVKKRSTDQGSSPLTRGKRVAIRG